MRKSILAAALIAAAAAGGVVVFFGFGGGKAPDARIAVLETDAPAKSKEITIHFIPKNLGNPYFEAVSTGFYDAISELGDETFKYVYTGPQTAEPDSQIEFVKKAIEDKADAIFIAANSSTALNAVFGEARGAGIRVYSINLDIPGSEAYRDAAIMPVNFNTIGGAQIELLGSQIGYEGPFAILSATADAPDQNTWIGLMKKALEENPKYADMKLLEVVYGDDQPEKSASETEALLSKYPDIKGIVVPSSVGIVAACRVVRESGLSGKVKVTGLGLPSEMAEFVDDGTCEGFQLWNPPYEGYIGVYMVWAEKKEGFVPVPGAKFKARKLGEYTIQPNGQILTLETPMLYDKSNIDRYSALF
ncbi:MAG: rhamnose ABC transporter substrate-binding protein [Synergistaceae bacterium]|jgi:rhamnose transport system substrate-binding protein|nr:rhamnose ABC transporter substrate-binding protein [Synergistaceae bacterium]